MKLKLQETPVESSAVFKETSFGIGNLAVILEILRSKMYSNPIKALCQEIMSNSRDAHVEVNKKDTPIEVTLPTLVDSHIRFRDFGPGITPERMTGVFLLYGASTKRDSDSQIGGFGLGAKTPFAYTDSFSIVSITPDESGQMWRREYIAVIDQTRIGKMNVVKEEHTEEKQGTTIIVPVRMTDFGAFTEAVQRTGRYWRVKPLVGPHAAWTWDEPEYAYTGNGWSMMEAKHESIIVIDGIQYPLEIDRVCKSYGGEEEIYKLADHGVVLHFKTGDIQVTANREALDLTPKSIDFIKERLTECYKELRRWVDERVDAAQTYLEAVELFRRFHEFGMETEWKGYKLTEQPIRLSNNQMVKVARYERDSESLNGFTRKKADRMRQSEYYYITMKEIFSTETMVVENDEYSLNRIAWLFAEKPINELILVTFNEVKHRDWYVSEANWDQFGFTKLSQHPKKKLNFVAPNTQGATIHAMKRFEPEESPPWVGCKTDLATGEGYYIVLEHRRPIWRGAPIKKERLAGLLHQISDADEDIVLHGVLMNRQSKLGTGWKHLETLLRERIAKIEKDPLLQAHIQNDDTPRNALSYAGTMFFEALCGLLPDEHLLNRWVIAVDAGKHAQALFDRLCALKDLVGEARPEKPKATPWVETIIQKYPLLIPIFKGVDSLDSIEHKNLLTPVLAYVKAQDAIQPITPVAANVPDAVDPAPAAINSSVAVA